MKSWFILTGFFFFWDDQFAALWVFLLVLWPTLSLHTKPTTPFQSTSTLTSLVKRSKVDPTGIIMIPSGPSTLGQKCWWPVPISRTDMEAGNASTQHPNNNLVTTLVTILAAVEEGIATHNSRWFHYHSTDKNQCGPVSIEAVRRGEVGFAFDTPFTFAEVNAEVCHFQEDDSSHWGFKKIKVDKYRWVILPFSCQYENRQLGVKTYRGPLYRPLLTL